MLDSEDDIFIIEEPGQPPVIQVNPLNVTLPELPVIGQDTKLSVSDLRSGVTDSGTMLRAATVVTTRSEEHTSELQSLMRISYAVFCLKKKNSHNPSEHT